MASSSATTLLQRNERHQLTLLDIGPDFVSLIVPFLTGTETAKLQLCSSYFNNLLSHDRVWERLCERSCFRQTGTKRRHTRPWKEVYTSSICIECREVNGAIVFLDLEGGRASGPSSKLAALCAICFTSVQQVEIRDRQKRQGPSHVGRHLLPRVRSRFFAAGMNLEYAQILLKIPEPKKKKKKKKKKKSTGSSSSAGATSLHRRGDTGDWDPENNNFMLRMLKKM